jgi:hypothetical protein
MENLINEMDQKRERTAEELEFIAFMKLLMEQFDELKQGAPTLRIFTMTQIYKYFDKNIHIMKPHEQLTISVRNKTISFLEELGCMAFKYGDDEKLLESITGLSDVMFLVLAKLGRK